MASLSPDVLIACHIQKLRSRPDQEKIDELLSRTGLALEGDQALRAGRPATIADCQNYKRMVREIYGEATYAFTRVNFVLGGCSCPDCAN
jgi:hypothetical protein